MREIRMSGSMSVNAEARVAGSPGPQRSAGAGHPAGLGLDGRLDGGVAPLMLARNAADAPAGSFRAPRSSSHAISSAPSLNRAS
jgi:hypothetical protein